jgi:hypothetical protein
MSLIASEPQQLLVRLERKYARKIQAIEARRKVKNLRNSLSRIDGANIDYLKHELNSSQHFDQID